MTGEGDYGATGEMQIGRAYRSTPRKPAPVSLCPPPIPLDQTRDRTRATVVGSQQLMQHLVNTPSTLGYDIMQQ
jgi:hypothetical protein